MDKKELEKYVRAFKKGDEQAFDILYNETSPAVYYTILSILHDESLSEDIMQETYIKMIEELDRYKGKNEFTAWIKTIARNKALNEYKRRQKEFSVDSAESEYLFDSVHPSSEKEYYLKKLLEDLPKDEREIVLRHVILEDKHKDIAKKLDMPLGTVLWKYQKALKTLRKKGGDDNERTY